jgi:hypothetical protein
VRLPTEGTLGLGVNPSGATVLARGWARMRSRPLVDEACALSVVYGLFGRCFPTGLRSIGVPLITVIDSSPRALKGV